MRFPTKSSVAHPHTSASIIADSMSDQGVRLTTFEVEFPRWILCEVNTHRAISKNGASSRAIPLKRAVDLIRERPIYPVRWVARELDGIKKADARGITHISGDEFHSGNLRGWIQNRQLIRDNVVHD